MKQYQVFAVCKETNQVESDKRINAQCTYAEAIVFPTLEEAQERMRKKASSLSEWYTFEIREV